MPNESLIRQIETLRDAYVRHQKAAAALQASLKTVTASQSRVQKALFDYGEQNAAANVTAAQATLSETRLKEGVVDPLLPSLRRDLKMLTALTAALRDAGAALQSEPVDVARLDKARLALQIIQQPDVQSLLPDLNEELDVAQRALGNEFGYKLRDALAAQGINIGGRGTEFTIGRFELNANFARRTMALRYGRDMVIPRVAVTIDAALRAYASAVKAISGRDQDGRAWIAQFHEAYQIARRKRASTEPRVSIVECYIELVLLRQGRLFAAEPSKRTFTDYSRAQFIYDFYEVANHQRLSQNGYFVKAHVAAKAQTDNPAKCMWVVEGDSPYDGRYIADIEFVKE